ncbi:MAG: helix-turn-helix domain-containing protein [Lachnospiraceae bacterium]
MEIKDFSTGELADIVSESELEEYKEILKNLTVQQEECATVIEKIMEENQYTVSKFAELCGVSRATVNKWLKGSVPKSREMFLKIGFAAQYSLDEMNHFLTRYGRYPKLYAKSLEDTVCIFVLTSDSIEHTYRACQKIQKLIQEEMTGAEESSVVEETSDVVLQIMNLSSVPKLLQFVKENAGIYKKQYAKLYAYIKMFIKRNLLEDFSNEDNVSLLADGQQWSASLRRCVSEISQNRWYPQRNKIISLGIHLNMDKDQINDVLTLAQMETLYPKNPFESAILYALEKAEINEGIYQDGTDSLCMYVKKVLEELQFTDIKFYLEELPKHSYEEEMF